jgi:hypothetical protein
MRIFYSRASLYYFKMMKANMIQCTESVEIQWAVTLVIQYASLFVFFATYFINYTPQICEISVMQTCKLLLV